MGRLKSIAEAALGEKVKYAVVAAAPGFDVDPERGQAKPASLQNFDNDNNPMGAAASLAGLTVVGIVKEPIAAAMAYRMDDLYSERNIVVYDMGGEKVRITVMIVDDGVFEYWTQYRSLSEAAI
ncbi:glucose-regulated 78 of hsp70 family [Apiospora phragmitis]|uniref:Glucose-regulated 78 of hsp70 family n=1 Tax=Apiospora phragmitis TaxID=2905665 RepID=A0ABR1WR24_9PEZI